jgi:Calcineurin-like phosphoesterase
MVVLLLFWCYAVNLFLLLLESSVSTTIQNLQKTTCTSSCRVNSIIFVSSNLQKIVPISIASRRSKKYNNRQQKVPATKMIQRLLPKRVDNFSDQNYMFQSVSRTISAGFSSPYQVHVNTFKTNNFYHLTHCNYRNKSFWMKSSAFLSSLSTSIFLTPMSSTAFTKSFERNLSTTANSDFPQRFVAGQRWIVGDNVLIPMSLLPASIQQSIFPKQQHSSNGSIDNDHKEIKSDHQIYEIGTRQFYPGIICEIRGSGWYTVQIVVPQRGSDGTTTTRVKCRGTQIRQSTTQPTAADCDENTEGRFSDRVNDENLTSPTNDGLRIRDMDETHELESSKEQYQKSIRYKPKKSLGTSTSDKHTYSYDNRINSQKFGLGMDALNVDTKLVNEFLSNLQQQQLHQVQYVSARRQSKQNPEKPVPPSPTIYDLDSYRKQYQQQLYNTTSNSKSASTIAFQTQINKMNEYYEQIQYFATNVKEWIVFTDLHCSPQTLPTCLEVIDMVHSIAVQRTQRLRSSPSSSLMTFNDAHNNAYCGILFLGDFWHHRQTMRIDCLNTILAKFKSTFTVPMIMIPGNHDQITLGGTNHALTPLENSYRITIPPFYKRSDDSFTKRMRSSSSTLALSSLPGVLIFSHPTKFQNAFFIPHIRDCAIMESIVQSKLCYDDSEAIFVHADVTGACMNDLIVSTGGIPPTMFPPNKPIFSGHFHKPHVVTVSSKLSHEDSHFSDDHSINSIKIEYVGSPYEVSLAEAEQAKAVLVLDPFNQWKCIQRIPLDVGRKHYKVKSLNELVALITKAKNGDRIVFDLHSKILGFPENDSDMEETLTKFRDMGVTVEVRETYHGRDLVSDTIDDDGRAMVASEDYTPTVLWKSFLNCEDQSGKLKVPRDVLEKVGLEILDQLDNGDIENKNGEKILLSGSSSLELSSVSIIGFGPFRDQVTYPLSDRGLVLIRGCNNDGGSDRYEPTKLLYYAFFNQIL